jgi:hypothetical protein
MRVLTWIYAGQQAVPVNYAHLELDYNDLTFFTFGGNNYRQLINDYADANNGQGFITEYAQPTTELAVGHPLLQELGAQYPYVTRLSAVISPEEMTIDPLFDYDQQAEDVSNIHDLSGWAGPGLYDCQKDGSGDQTIVNPPPLPLPEPVATFVEETFAPADDSRGGFAWGVALGVGVAVLIAGALLLGVLIGRRSGGE